MWERILILSNCRGAAAFSDLEDADEEEVSDAADEAVDLISESDEDQGHTTARPSSTPATSRKRRPAPGAALSTGACLTLSNPKHMIEGSGQLLRCDDRTVSIDPTEHIN